MPGTVTLERDGIRVTTSEDNAEELKKLGWREPATGRRTSSTAKK